MRRGLSPALVRRGTGHWNGEAQGTRAGTGERGPHSAPRGTVGEIEEPQQHKSYVQKGQSMKLLSHV